MLLYEVLKTVKYGDEDRVILTNPKGTIYISFEYGGREWIAPVLLATKVKTIKPRYDSLVITLEDLNKEAR